MGIVTLITDFGLTDEYVGVVKGQILCRAENARIIDISHGIAPQNIRGAALMLKASYRFFPEGTVHVVIVDPGVGSSRRIVAVQGGGFCLVVPDNGLASWVCELVTPDKIVSVEGRPWFTEKVSSTFHGRDIFAPAAGSLAAGTAITALGPEVTQKSLEPHAMTASVEGNEFEICGEIVHIDHFGNLVTNIDTARLGTVFQGKRIEVHYKTMVLSLSKTYVDADKGKPLALIGSREVIEIAVNCDSAKMILDGSLGEKVIARRQ